MSILKGILHHWNKTSSAYDTIHPETESAQVTDWNSGIVGTLASTALGSLVTTLSSDSLLAKLIEKVLSATGVKYQTGQNGYLCLGSLFGGLIIQWGVTTCRNAKAKAPAAATATLPISFSKTNYLVNTSLVSGGTDYNWDAFTTWGIPKGLNVVDLCVSGYCDIISPVLNWIAIGK